MYFRKDRGCEVFFSHSLKKPNRFSIERTPRTIGVVRSAIFLGHPRRCARRKAVPGESRGRIQIGRTPRLLYASRYKVPAFPLPRSLFLPRSGDSRARGIVLLLLLRSDIICEPSYDLNKFSLHLFEALVVSAASRERNRFSFRADVRAPCNYGRNCSGGCTARGTAASSRPDARRLSRGCRVFA